MPKDVSKYITTLDDLYKKLEYTLDGYEDVVDVETVLEHLNDAIENLTEINDELDTQLEE